MKPNDDARARDTAPLLLLASRIHQWRVHDDAGYDAALELLCDAEDILRREAALVQGRGVPQASESLKHLASAMRKVLPPALLQEVIAHLDPLTPFVDFLQKESTSMTNKELDEIELPARDSVADYIDGVGHRRFVRDGEAEADGAGRIGEPPPLPDLANAAEMLWVVLANVSGGDWTQQTPEWQEAAARWRDNYFAAVKAAGGGTAPPHP